MVGVWLWSQVPWKCLYFVFLFRLFLLVIELLFGVFHSVCIRCLSSGFQDFLDKSLFSFWNLFSSPSLLFVLILPVSSLLSHSLHRISLFSCLWVLGLLRCTDWHLWHSGYSRYVFVYFLFRFAVLSSHMQPSHSVPLSPSLWFPPAILILGLPFILDILAPCPSLLLWQSCASSAATAHLWHLSFQYLGRGFGPWLPSGSFLPKLLSGLSSVNTVS